MPRIYNKRRETYPAEAVLCDRTTAYGNPYLIGRDGDRDDVCDLFETKVLPGLDVSALHGKDLVCWCVPLRCHCQGIRRKIEQEIADEIAPLI